jgi:hypothetical protein
MFLESLVRFCTICGDILYIEMDWGHLRSSCSGLTSSRPIGSLLPQQVQQIHFFSGPFNPPGQANDIPRFNAMTKNILGYEQIGYWYAFTEEGFGKVIGDHVSYVANSPI